MSTHRRAGGASCAPDALLETFGIEASKGRLVPLKTRGEIRAGDATVDVHVVELPARSANAVLSILRNTITDQATVDLQHLRRVIKPAALPARALALLAASRITAPPDAGETRLLLVCPSTLIPHADLHATLAAHPPFTTASDTPSSSPARPFPLAIHTLPVPAFPPTSAARAESWTATYWPVSYKNTNPYGPHPSIIERARAEMAPRASEWMALAAEAARQAAGKGMGEAVGCAIVERKLDANGRAVTEGRVVAVAGDGRRCGLAVPEADGRDEEGGSCGNVMAHAAMRAIGLVAEKRLRVAPSRSSSSSSSSSQPLSQAPPETAPVTSVFASTPLTPLESAVFALDNLAPGGYVCADLEIYMTHEPCVMCSMAILHSRFNRCVFARRMPRTGAMTAEADGEGSGLGHGLFWRPAELNWRFLCWEWLREGEGSEMRNGEVDENINA